MTPSAVINDLAVLTLLVVTLGYIGTCVIWPFKACRHCHGTGRLHNPLLGAIRLCPRCEATGLRLRAGRRAWNAYRHLHRGIRRDLNHRNRR